MHETKLTERETKRCPFCGQFPVYSHYDDHLPGQHEISCDNANCPANPSVESNSVENVFVLWETRYD